MFCIVFTAVCLLIALIKTIINVLTGTMLIHVDVIFVKDARCETDKISHRTERQPWKVFRQTFETQAAAIRKTRSPTADNQ